jgi:hypothetical protein
MCGQGQRAGLRLDVHITDGAYSAQSAPPEFFITSSQCAPSQTHLPAMPENENNMIGQGITVSTFRRLSTPSTVPLEYQYFTANSLFLNTLRVSTYLSIL